MKQLCFLIITLLFFSCKVSKTKTDKKIENILFIGNSLTYFYDMPTMVQDMLNESNPGINVEQSTYPGMSLTGHLDQIVMASTENSIDTRAKEIGEISNTEKKIKEKNWDIIIFQEATINLYIPEKREYLTDTAISKMKAMATNKNCKFILFTTWPTGSDYPKEYCYPSIMISRDIEKKQSCSPKIKNLKEEISLLNSAYYKTAKKLYLKKSNNADKVYNMLTNYPDIEIYADKSHPNANGAFLNACVFFEMISGKQAIDLKYNNKLNPETAQLIKEVVSNNKRK